MKENRKTYDRNFKEKAVQLSYERDNISQLAKELGITAPLLYKWRQDCQEFGTGSFPEKGKLKLSPEQEKIHELKKKIKRNRIRTWYSKKAISIFSKGVPSITIYL
ncbi:transposase [Flavobacterium agrisoli]|uniref:Transposase n=1 Tax=Flavobacterium agrisoli TaxID=2793066 RepID=A0A934PKU7_9FLAO|nr:transposase [Flavobacterium agrisoli]MBK0368704.1 transposase [Flavobacterium agrisoli]